MPLASTGGSTELPCSRSDPAGALSWNWSLSKVAPCILPVPADVLTQHRSPSKTAPIPPVLVRHLSGTGNPQSDSFPGSDLTYQKSADSCEGATWPASHISVCTAFAAQPQSSHEGHPGVTLDTWGVALLGPQRRLLQKAALSDPGNVADMPNS